MNGSVVLRLRILGTSDDYIESVRLSRSLNLALRHRVVLDRHASPAGESIEGTPVPSIGALTATVPTAAVPAVLEFLVTWLAAEGRDGQQIAVSLSGTGAQPEVRISRATTLDEARAYASTIGTASR